MPVRITIIHKGHILKMDKLSKTLYKRMVSVWDKAIGAYIMAVAKIVSRYQDTGMSYASLFPLARRIKQSLPPVSPKVDRRKPYTTLSGYVFKNQFKSSALGEKLGGASSKIGYGVVGRPKLFFEFEPRVFQYMLNEFGFGNLPLALNSMEAGRKAMINYLKKHGKEAIPRFREIFDQYEEIR